MAIPFHPLLFWRRVVRTLEEQEYTSDGWVDLSYDMRGRSVVEEALPTMSDVERQEIFTFDQRFRRAPIPGVKRAGLLNTYHTARKSETGCLWHVTSEDDSIPEVPWQAV